MAVPHTSARAALPGDVELDGQAGKRPIIAGPARLDVRTKGLVRRLQAGEIAVLDHAEIDRLSAEELVAGGVACVVNVAPSLSERYPNPGPGVLVAAGVPLIDAPGSPLFDQLRDGDEVAVDGEGTVSRAGVVLARGRVVDRAAVAEALDHARGALDRALEAFVANTLARVASERDLVAEATAGPTLTTDLRDRPALVAVRGSGVVDQLHSLRAYIRDERPVLVGVDGGADALLAAGLRPQLIVGDMDSASDRALRDGAELVVHSYRDGRAPGAERLRALGLAHRLVSTVGTSEDAALALAAEQGARPIVTVGSPRGLVDFLDRGRAGMASTLLTRLRLGDLLVDASAVALLHRS